MIVSEQGHMAPERRSTFLVDAAGIEEMFGRPARVYVPLVRGIIPKIFGVKYEFEENSVFEEKIRNGAYGPPEINMICWREILFRAHIVVAASLFRTCRLLDAAVREHRTSNVPGWASCTRALLEATGDSSSALQAIPLTLAENHHLIRRCLSGKERRVWGSRDLEDRMIHFTHGRKLRPGEEKAAPSSHQAKSSSNYVRELARYSGMSEALALYGELCQLSHPAADSVAYFFSPVDDGPGFGIDPSRDRDKIDEVVDRYQGLFESFLSVALNPILLSIGVFHRFDLFPKIPELQKMNFSGIPLWAKIEAYLKKA